MKMKKVFVVAMALMLGAATSVSAQKAGLSLQLGGILPSLDFKESPSVAVPGAHSFGSAGGAMFGASFGLKYTYMIKNKAHENIGLGVFFSADGMWNAMNKDLRTLYDSVSCTHPQYVNVPIMVGVSYTTQFSPTFGLWVEAGIGADLFIKTAEGWKNNSTTYKMSAEMAVEGGVGIILDRTISLGAHYYWLGTHHMMTKKPQPPVSHALKMGVWAFKLGFHL